MLITDCVHVGTSVVMYTLYSAVSMYTYFTYFVIEIMLIDHTHLRSKMYVITLIVVLYYV